MKRYIQYVVLILLPLMSSVCQGQCDFKTFVHTYFDVYETSDTLTELELYGKGLHKWHLKHTDEFANFPNINASNYRELYDQNAD